MKSFVTRALSALLGILVVYLLYHFLGADGLRLFCLVALLIAAHELLRILFKPTDSKLNRFAFYTFIVCIFLLSTQYPQHGGIIFAFFSICFCLVSLLTHGKFGNLSALMSFQARAVLGFLYVGLLPSFTVAILDQVNGTVWFLTLLVVVFAGDIGAYLSGMAFGKNKLMPSISPKKTIEGALGGLVCSGIAGGLMGLNLPHVSTVSLVLLSVAAGVTGQFGDLFESQLKRVADVKDSGSIMPGHGGVLDRIDGVLFASPIIYLGAIVLESPLSALN